MLVVQCFFDEVGSDNSYGCTGPSSVARLAKGGRVDFASMKISDFGLPIFRHLNTGAIPGTGNILSSFCILLLGKVVGECIDIPLLVIHTFCSLNWGDRFIGRRPLFSVMPTTITRCLCHGYVKLGLETLHALRHKMAALARREDLALSRKSSTSPRISSLSYAYL